MFDGGVLQYMATVQGMPIHIGNLLQKKINKFIWGGKKGTINKTHLNIPIEKGGISLLNIQARNEVIDIIGLKFISPPQGQPGQD